MEKQKVTVEFQNEFCDRLYNEVQKAEFEWLKKHCRNKKAWNDLIEDVDGAIFLVISMFFENTIFCANNTELLTVGKGKTAEQILAEKDESSPAYCALKKFYGTK